MLIVQMSDLHLTSVGTKAYDHVDTHAMLARAVRRINALVPPPDLVIATGDLTDHGTEEQYRLLAEQLRRITAPVAVVMGNHDDRLALTTVLRGFGNWPESGFVQYVIETRPVRVIVLDSTRPDSHKADFCAERASWLDDRLAEAPDVPTLIAIHHPPLDVGIAWMDGAGAGWADTLVQVFARHDQIVRVICGHLHRPIFAIVGGRALSVAPSIAHQVRFDLTPGIDPDHPPQFEMEPPAIQVHAWDGRRLLTHTVHIEEYERITPFTKDAFAALLRARETGEKPQF